MSEKHRGSGRAGAAAEGRARVRGGGGGGPSRDAQMDLVTAALIGLAVGVSATLLLRRGPRGVRPIGPVVRAAARAGQRGPGGCATGVRMPGSASRVTRSRIRCRTMPGPPVMQSIARCTMSCGRYGAPCAHKPGAWPAEA